MSRESETERGKYDGIILMILSTIVLAFMLMSGCKRDNTFSEATREMPAYEEPAPEPAVREAVAEESSVEDAAEPAEAPIGRIRVNMIGRLKDVFNDSNKYQYAAAERLGIKPLTSVGNTYFTTRPIVKVTTNKYYMVDSLKHSFPYLVPEAEALLRTIGANFIDSLAKRGARNYRIIVTSLLRTPHTVKKLRRVNRNAVDSSTHQFGTTFDISYHRFDKLDSSRTINDGDLKNLLGEVLLDLRNQQRCLVKYEHRGGCFHITATR